MTLRGLDPSSILFTDHPYHIAKNESTSKILGFLRNIHSNMKINALIVGYSKNTKKSMVFEIDNISPMLSNKHAASTVITFKKIKGDDHSFNTPANRTIALHRPTIFIDSFCFIGFC